MLAKLGVKYVIVGHSERRQYFNEDDELVNRKARAVLGAGMRRSSASARSWRSARPAAPPRSSRARSAAPWPASAATQVAGLVVAYEPVWAIGTGRAATADDAQETIAVIRATVADMVGQAAADEPASSTAAASSPPTPRSWPPSPTSTAPSSAGPASTPTSSP